MFQVHSPSTSADEPPSLTMQKVSAHWRSLLLGTALILAAPSEVFAQTSLTSARVESLRNRVHLIPTGNQARLARVSDVMSIGDALRTAASARAELSFNDGSLARVGEQATFRFTPNTRNFQLSNGTVLLLIPPGRGRTTIQTPNAVTGIQGSALFVRVRCLAELSSEGYCASPVTFVGALTNNPAGAMVAYNENGSQQQPLYAGEMVVIEDGNISQRLEFDLRTFYQTAGLAAGLNLDSPTPPAELSDDLQEVWQEIQDALELQGDFDRQGSAEEVVENPDFISPVVNADGTDIEELDAPENNNVFAGFPRFASSPAASFHSLGQLATSQSPGSYIATETAETTEVGNTASGLVTPVTSARVRETLGAAPAAAIINQGTILPSGSSALVIQPSAATNRNIAPAPVIPVSEPSTGEVLSPPNNVVTPSTPLTTVVPAATPVVPQTVDNTIVKPPSNPIATVPEVTPTINATVPPTTVPTPAIEPVQVVTPTVPATAAAPAPVIEAPTLVPATPTVVPTTDTVAIPEQQPIIPEADQAPTREAVSENTFDWQSAGTNDPEVLPTVGLPASEAETNNLSVPQSEPNTSTDIPL